MMVVVVTRPHRNNLLVVVVFFYGSRPEAHFDCLLFYSSLSWRSERAFFFWLSKWFEV